MVGSNYLSGKKLVPAFCVLAMLLIAPCYADLNLVTSSDFIRIYDSPDIDTRKEIDSLEIAGFRNFPFFGKNNTINGRACYSPDAKLREEIIKEQWMDKIDDPNADWVILMPFDNNQFLPSLETIETRITQAQSVIFTYDGTPHITNGAPDDLTSPKIISFARRIELDDINLQNHAFPKNSDYYFEHDHSYTQHCDIMKPAFKFYLIAISVWGFITVFHILWTWILKKDHSKHLQKILLFIPVFFAGYTLIDYVYFMSCPWSASNGVQYLQIVQIALVTIFNTLFVGLCCFISKGWSIVRNSFTREELSSITMIVGIFYLVYSAYFIASDIASLRVVIIVILIIMYLWVALTCLKNSITNIRTLKSHIGVTGSDEVILESLKLKKYLMQHFWIITMLFYGNKIIHSALKTFVKGNATVRNIIIVNLFIELLIISYFLVVFRARKWPEYFGLDIFYQRIGNNDDEQNLPKSIILNAVTSSQWISNPESKDWMINGDEVDRLGDEKYKEPQVAVLVDTSDNDNLKLFKLLRNEEVLSDDE